MPHRLQIERRAHPRFRIGVQVVLVIAGHPGRPGAELVNLSLGGCLFVTSASDLKDDWLVAMSFIAGPRSLCMATGRSVRRAGLGFGVEFRSVNDGLRSFITRIADTPEADRAQVVDRIAAAEIHIV